MDRPLLEQGHTKVFTERGHFNTGACLARHQALEGKTVKNQPEKPWMRSWWTRCGSTSTSPPMSSTRRSNSREQLGATILRDLSENGNHWITMADPEGNEFDLIGI